LLEQEAKLFVTRWIVSECDVLVELNFAIIIIIIIIIIMPTIIYGRMRHKSVRSVIVYGGVMILYFVHTPLEVHNE
jgi:hypothetical protein